MSTNSNTKSYWRRVTQLSKGLVHALAYNAGGDNSVTEIIAALDPKATQAMHREAIKMAIQDCGFMVPVYTELTDRHREALAILQAYRERKPLSLRVIEGGLGCE